MAKKVAKKETNSDFVRTTVLSELHCVHAQIILAIALLVVSYGVYLAFTSVPEPPIYMECPYHDTSMIKIVFLPDGTASINATSWSCVAFAQGLVASRLRLFQLALIRQAAIGKLHQWFGSRALPSDRIFAALGFNDNAFFQVNNNDGSVQNRPSEAQEAFMGVPKEVSVRQLCNQFASGINEGIKYLSDVGRWPLEFYATLGTQTVQKFSCNDLTAMNRFIAFQLSQGSSLELYNEALQDLADSHPQLKDALAVNYDFEYFGTTIPKGKGTPYDDQKPLKELPALREKRAATSEDIKRVKQALYDLGGFRINSGGSNAFAVAGTHTQSGKPVMAGDPHLPFSAPSFWMKIEVVEMLSGIQFSGFTAPSMLGIAVGRSTHHAYSMTVSTHDAEDVFLITYTKCPEGSSASRCYEGKEGPMPLTIQELQLGNTTLVAEYSHYGPILNPADFPAVHLYLQRRGLLGTHALALSTPALMQPLNFAVFLQMAIAETTDALEAAIASSPLCQFNAVFASSNDIGYRLMGSIPLRSCGNGSMVNGW